MSQLGEHFWQYGIRCDHPGCKAAIWRVGASEQSAHTLVQRDAIDSGWIVVRDRLVGGVDLCREHAQWG